MPEIGLSMLLVINEQVEPELLLGLLYLTIKI